MNGANPEISEFKKLFPINLYWFFKTSKFLRILGISENEVFRAERFKILMSCSSLFVDMLKVSHE